MIERIRYVLRSYGIVGTFRLLGWLVYTRLLMRHARLIRPPLYLRGHGSMQFGPGFTAGRFNRIEVLDVARPCSQLSDGTPRLTFGSNVQINDANHIAAVQNVSIGDDVLIASRVFIADHNHGRFDNSDPFEGPDTPPADRMLSVKAVRIGNKVWIGEGACILPGVTIGDGAVIGAGAVVTRDIPARCVAAGNPAKVIRRYDDESREWKRV